MSIVALYVRNINELRFASAAYFIGNFNRRIAHARINHNATTRSESRARAQNYLAMRRAKIAAVREVGTAMISKS